MSLLDSHIQNIQKFSAEIFDTLVSLRRDLHQHPELSGNESWTANTLAERLVRMGLEVQTDVGGYGLIADLITNPELDTVALRVDMDALPLEETNKTPYRSQVPGVMHACGHDIHSAIGIGTAAVLTALSEYLPGNIRFIFQPEEEEITGATKMIRAGALKHPEPKAIFGLHVAPIPSGQIAWSDGLFLAGFDHYLGKISPQEGARLSPNHLNAVGIRCCQVIQNFNKFHLPLTWKNMRAFWQMMQEGPHDLQHFMVFDATMNEENPSAWVGEFGIGIKAANHHLRRAALGRIRAALNTICRATRTQYRIEPMGTMLDMRNNQHLVRSSLPALRKAIGNKNLIALKAAFPFNCEDFAYFTQQIPGAMYWLGAADPSKGKYAMLHTPDFDVDERCLETGTIAMATILFNSLLIN